MENFKENIFYILFKKPLSTEFIFSQKISEKVMAQCFWETLLVKA